jgi:hypothetical protein
MGGAKDGCPRFGVRRLAVTLDWQLGTCPVPRCPPPYPLPPLLADRRPLCSVIAFFRHVAALAIADSPPPPLLSDITIRNEPPVNGSVLEIEDSWLLVGIRGRLFIFLSLLLSDSSGVNGQPAC